jgi:tripartite-type tricarboxylate transporter receptor subunit TctC
MPILRSFGFVAIALIGPTAAAMAQDWPGKQPIKIVVPFTAGSATDITARTVFEQVGKQIGQTFIVENRGGAGTTLGMTQVAKSDPDGYTMLVHSTSHVVVASTYPNLPFNVAEEFAAVSALADVPFVITTATKYKTLKDMIDAGKAPGAMIHYGSAGAGSSGHLFMERFRLAAGFAATHVPFRGTPEGMTEVIAGRIDAYPAPAVNAVPLSKDGKVSALAVSSAKRLPLMPDVRTVAEAGLPGAAYNFWVGAFLPAKTRSRSSSVSTRKSSRRSRCRRWSTRSSRSAARRCRWRRRSSTRSCARRSRSTPRS